jgi:hypothetical protein
MRSVTLRVPVERSRFAAVVDDRSARPCPVTPSVVALSSALPGIAAPKEASVDKSIEQMGQDLALSKYAESVQRK